MADAQVTRMTRSVVVAVSDTALRQAIITRLALASGLEFDVREGVASEVSAQDIVIATPPDCSPNLYRELVRRGARVILVSAGYRDRPHRHYLRVGLRTCVTVRRLWDEEILVALREAASEPEQAAP